MASHFIREGRTIMKLKLLAISDTHLGEPTSLLSYPQGLWHLWESLRTVFTGSKKDPVEIEELILLGDIPDRTLSSTSEITTHTNALIRTLGSAAKVTKGVYIPGNHDHTLWTTYVNYPKHAKQHKTKYAITAPAGEQLIGPNNYVPEDRAKEMLSIFFGYDKGSVWRTITDQNIFSFYVANPLYATFVKFEGGNSRTYVFSHGTLFKTEVCLPETIRILIDKVQIDAIAGLDLESGGDVRNAHDLLTLERVAGTFGDSMWPSSRNNRRSKANELWYLFSKLRGLTVQPREMNYETNCLFNREELSNENDPKRFKVLVTQDGELNSSSLQRWKKWFLPEMRQYLKINNIPSEEITFVYGDTHEGGWGHDWKTPEGHTIRIYNTGAWVVDESGQHPPCHLFAVDEEGREYMVDISFKSQTINGDSLLSLAGEEVTLGNARASKIFRAVILVLIRVIKTLSTLAGLRGKWRQEW
jgi:hypothetical protein